jgi:predicted alpha/beta superfamily hydrolase
MCLMAVAPAEAGPAPANVQPLAGGELALYPDFPSKQVEPRKVYVWTPRGYAGSQARYDVLYVEDGQNLFLPADAYGGRTWGAAEALQALIDAGEARPAIIVGIWNTPRRGQEYAPAAGQSPAGLERLAKDWGGPVVSDRYVRFLADELKPFIDARYRTRSDPRHTFLMGSSMGGLISLYAQIERPDQFGAAACLSPHWPVRNPLVMGDPPAPETAAIADAFLDWVGRELAPPGRGRFYFDHGDQGLDRFYAPFQARMDEILRRRGYVQGPDFESLAFPGATHNEDAWRARIDRPLRFLLGRGEAPKSE